MNGKAHEGLEIKEHVSARHKAVEAHLAVVAQFAKPVRNQFVTKRRVSKFYPLLGNPGIAFIGRLADGEAQNPFLHDFFANVIMDPRGPRAIAEKLGTARLVLNNTKPSPEILKQIEFFLECAVNDIVSAGEPQESQGEESPWERLSSQCGMKRLGAQLFQPQALYDYLDTLCLQLMLAQRDLSTEESDKMCKIINTYEQLAERIRVYLECRVRKVSDIQQETSWEVNGAAQMAITENPMPPAPTCRGSPNVLAASFDEPLTPSPLLGIMATAIARTIKIATHHLRVQALF